MFKTSSLVENIDAEPILQMCRLCFRVKKAWLLNAVLLDIWRFDIIEKHFININKHGPAVDVYFIIDIWERHWRRPAVLLQSLTAWTRRAFDWLYKELKSVISRTAALFIVLTLKRISRFQSSVLVGASNGFLEKLSSVYESNKIILNPLC